MSEGNENVTLNPPLNKENINKLKAGDLVEITGTILTARDKSYEKILKITREGKDPPVDLNGQIIYHCGPLAKPAEEGPEILAAGPTTSARLDDMQIEFVENTGVRGLVGKGGVSEEVASKLGSLGCIYFSFTGGAAALAADAITSVEDLIWEDLGTAEAIWVLKVKKFGPLVVSVDTAGNNLYE